MDETLDIQWTNLTEVMNILGQKLITLYREKLDEENVNASGKLYNSLQQIIQIDGDKYELDLRLEDYWKYVENGRKAGKWPPVDKIKEWIRIKPVLPYPDNNGRLPTESQLAFLIGRKIANEGITPRPLLERSIDEIDFEKEIKIAVQADIEAYLKVKWDAFINELFNEL